MFLDLLICFYLVNLRVYIQSVYSNTFTVHTFFTTLPYDLFTHTVPHTVYTNVVYSASRCAEGKHLHVVYSPSVWQTPSTSFAEGTKVVYRRWYKRGSTFGIYT